MSADYDVIVIGSGAAGMIAAIRAAREGRHVLLLEKLSRLGAKLKATGGGRCNLTNTLDHETFISKFGRDGRFLSPALHHLDATALRNFFEEIGVKSHAPDGYRVFPITHNASTILQALHQEMEYQGVDILCGHKVHNIFVDNGIISGVSTNMRSFYASHVIVATGGLGYPLLGAEGDGHRMVEPLGHTITPLYPAMMPLRVKESWVTYCRADTLPKVTLLVDIKKYRKRQATGDLIFTKRGIRGPVVLDFSREITPLLAQFDEVPILANFTKGMNEEQIRQHIKQELQTHHHKDTLTLLLTLLPLSVANALCTLAEIAPHSIWRQQNPQARDRLIKLLRWTPLTVNGHDGFKMAMITRGGIKLNEINPYTMQSKKCKGLYFCGEVMNLDGPCGGYNLQWAFSSGYLAGALLQ